MAVSSLATTNQKSLSQQAKKQTFSMFIGQDAIKKQINNIVGGENGQRFITSIISAVSTNPTLSECSHPTILSAALLGESLRLSPSPQLGQYYMVPFKKKAKFDKGGNLIEPETMVATFVLGYKGYIQLAIRSGYYRKINVISIKEGELVSYNPLDEELQVKLIEDDEVRENTPTIGYYAMFEYTNGFRKSIYWSKKKMLAHADKYSPAFDANSLAQLEQGQVPEKDMWKFSSFWYKDFDGMAHKTLLRQLISKWGIMSIEMQKAFEADDAIIGEDLTPDFVDNNEFEQVNEIATKQESNVEIEQPKEQKTTTTIGDNDDPFDVV